MPMLAEIVDVVIGVDTHKHTNTAAVVSAATGAAIDDITAATDPDGYSSLIALADRSPGLRAWAIEGANSYGAGLARFLVERGEWIIELDRPARAKRRHGAKSDPIDAVRAAREALAREHLSEPRAEGERDGEREGKGRRGPRRARGEGDEDGEKERDGDRKRRRGGRGR